MVDIDADEVFTLVNETAKDQRRNNDEEMFDTDVLNDEKVFAENVDFAKQAKEVVADKDIFDDITLAKALMEIKSENPRLIRIKEVNLAWDDVQVKIKVDFKLAQRLQEEEQEQLTDTEKEKLFMKFLEKRIKFFAAKRAKEKRNKPPTKTQQRSLICTYLKNMDGWKPRSLKNKSFAEIQELFDKAMKRINTFVDLRTELVKESTKKDEAKIAQESSLKRAGDELEQERSKKQKVEDDIESEELMKCLEIIPGDGYDVTIYATPLSFKSPTIVDYKIYKEGKKSYIQIFRVDDNS
nr:hypothetical protein [Tanacetum cinerariifolium]